jgi:peptidoglycan/LPS O-acetylase OafA/YrhL
MPTDYIRTLDGWRAIAIMSVILYHSNDIVIRGFSLGPIQAYGVAEFNCFLQSADS